MRRPQPVVIDAKPAVVNTGNIVAKLRRIRIELAGMLMLVDDALERIDQEKKAS